MSEEEREAKLIEIIQALSEMGMNKEANYLFQGIAKRIRFVDLGDDWVNEQVCSTFPRVSLKTMVFCCTPKNPCPYRAAVLRKIGLTEKDYVAIKRELAEKLIEILRRYDVSQV